MLESRLKSKSGSYIAVLVEEKQVNPIQGAALPFRELGINNRLLIISNSDSKEITLVKEQPKRAHERKIQRTTNRKSITFEGAITHNEETYRVNNGKGKKNLGLYIEILQRIIEQFEICRQKWRRVFVLRFELHLAFETSTNKCITDFKKRLFQKLKREYPFKDIGYCWAREYHGKGKGQHYHFVLFLDGNQIKHSSRINQIIRQAWQRPNGNHTMGKIKRPFYFVDNEEIAQEAIYRVSYLAKTRGKGHRENQVKDYHGSQIKPP